MKSILSVVVAVVASVLVACGGEEQCSDCNDVEGSTGQVGATACPANQCPPPDEDLDVVVFSDVKNTTTSERSCNLSYSLVLPGGATAPGGLLATTVPAGGVKTYNFYVPEGSRVVYTARCWHPGYPDVNEQASATITTTELFVAWGIHASYTGGSNPGMSIINSAY